MTRTRTRSERERVGTGMSVERILAVRGVGEARGSNIKLRIEAAMQPAEFPIIISPR